MNLVERLVGDMMDARKAEELPLRHLARNKQRKNNNASEPLAGRDVGERGP